LALYLGIWGTLFQVNKFTGTQDKLGFATPIPEDLDTSTRVRLILSYVQNQDETIQWTVKINRTIHGDSIYTTEPGGGSNPYTKTIIVSHAGVADTHESVIIELDFSDFITQRMGAPGDTVWIAIHSSAIAGTAAMFSIQAFYLKWAEGGHI